MSRGGRERPGSRPLHLQLPAILMVMGGGALGTLCRYWLNTAIPTPDGWPLPTLLINLSGAFALGLLLEALARRGPDVGMRRTLRLLAGTGFLGAFTTYSTLALDANLLLSADRIADAVAFMLLSVIGGLATGAAGVWVAAARRAAGPQESSGTETDAR
ncbi:CrcB family protein [Arthrobacter sp. CAU 1506]|uniref:fluoride efflux transporter FluC n=1 Tax=Arthrobacter sp. CAU 1506 TaxID=2560052 RepID=UPI0010AC69FA|nr:CrcB family protein [Arthrobacter sp. CAU 1506]TJY66359.1 CrcB family protein [Arthrobacter sp. CAU 1506]